MNQAMNEEDLFNLDDRTLLINETEEAIKELYEKTKFAEKVKRLFLNEDFQEVVLGNILGSEAEKSANNLLIPTLTIEEEQETLDVLKSLRLFKKLLNFKRNEAESAEFELHANKQYLATLLVKNEGE